MRTIVDSRGRIMSILALLAMAGSATCLAATPQSAAYSAPSMRVSYAGLDLSTTAGASILYARIKSAADMVCGHMHYDIRELAQREVWKQCRADAIANAIKAVDNPLLTALHETHEHPISTVSADSGHGRHHGS